MPMERYVMQGKTEQKENRPGFSDELLINANKHEKKNDINEDMKLPGFLYKKKTYRPLIQFIHSFFQGIFKKNEYDYMHNKVYIKMVIKIIN